MRAAAILLSLSAILIYTGNVSAQEVGSRVRVRDSSGVLATGTLVRLDSDAIVLRTSVLNNRGKWIEGDSAFPVTSDTRLDLSVGRSGGGGRGALMGFAIGMGLTTFMTIAGAASDDQSGYVDLSPGAVFLGGTLIFGGGGALIGFVVGSASESETWSEVPLDLPPKGDPYEVTQGMVQLGLRINF